jgi:hypothetical protein
MSQETKDKENPTRESSNSKSFASSTRYEIGMRVGHKDVYDGCESLIIRGIRKTTEDKVVMLLLEGDYSGGTHAVTQSSWLPSSGVVSYKPRYHNVNKQPTKNL